MLSRIAAALFALTFLLGATSNTLLACQEHKKIHELTTWAHENSDLAPDSAVRWGKLPNGFRYAIRENAEPRDRISLMLVVRAGSFHETDSQRGLAHFLEHMAFNGTKHFPPGTLVEFFQRLGMGFGPDTNAHTSFDRTVYELELPRNDPALIDEALKALRDYADGMLLLPEEIDQERGIILSEKRDRDSVDFRSMQAEWNFLLPESLLPKRFPIGVEDVIRGADRKEFLDFYETWYRPERMSVVAVGAIKPEDFAEKIAAYFGDLTKRAAFRDDPDLGTVAMREEIVAALHSETEASKTSVGIQVVMPARKRPDTAKNRLDDLPLQIANAVITLRLSELAKKEGAIFTSGTANSGEYLDHLRVAGIDVVASKPENWKAALAVAEQELRRALTYGFQESEIREVVANLINNLTQAAQRAPTRRSEAIAKELVDSIVENYVFTAPESELALQKPALEKLTPDVCLAALREIWSPKGRTIFVTGNLSIENAAATIVAAHNESAAVAVSAPVAASEQAFAYTNFGTPGTIAQRTHIEDLDITQVTFANGARLNLKRTDFEKEVVHIALRLGGGILTLPPEKSSLSLFTNLTFTAGGLGKHSTDELRKILAGRNVGLKFNIDTDAFEFSAPTTPGDLLLQLQLLAAQISDPGYRPEAIRQARKAIPQIYTQQRNTIEGQISLTVSRELASGDVRFGLPSEEMLGSLSQENVREWLAPEFASGALEISIVGDIDIEAAITAVAQTLGALPARAAKPAYANERVVSFPEKTFERTLLVKTEIPRGMVFIVWPTTDARDVAVARRLNFLSQVFSDRLRLKVREGMAGAYSPYAMNNSSDTFTDYGWLGVQVGIEPSQAANVINAVREIAEELRTKGIGKDELERIRQPILSHIAESARTNGYWLAVVMQNCQEFPQKLDWCRTRTSDYLAITAEEIDALAVHFLKPDRMAIYTILPEPAASPAPENPTPQK